MLKKQKKKNWQKRLYKMGKLGGFLEFDRTNESKESIKERLQNYKEFTKPLAEDELKNQGARCMDCGVPFCHSGCPLGNIIPEFNDLVYRGKWKEASHILHSTNNFPEFTGRLCPAPCEEACVLSINEPPVTIENIEKNIVEQAYKNGWITPQLPKERTDKTVAIIGSGPAGLATAQQLNRAGHNITVYERADRIGGLLRYGIPDFKMEKWVIDRRLKIMREEGIKFITNAHLGVNTPTSQLDKYDAVVLACGSTKPRDLPIKGREFKGIYQAMSFLPQQNKIVAGDTIKNIGEERISAKGKKVIVIGGGDTGSDCIGTSNRQGATSVTNFELFGRPDTGRSQNFPWPYWPMKLRTSTSHEEGCQRQWSIMTKEFIGDSKGNLTGLKTIQVEFEHIKGQPPKMKEIKGSEKTWDTDLVFLALGFIHPETDTFIKDLGLELDERGNVKAGNDYKTSKEGIFAAGDVRRGQSLIVWAISEGRECARSVDQYLTQTVTLPSKGSGDLPRI